ncbi:hypothetical protein K2X33_15020 [bacterium]|nr:hypothetical protein [bacterium]
MRNFVFGVLFLSASAFAAVEETSSVPAGATETFANPGAERLKIDLFSYGYSSSFSNFNGRRATHDNTDGDPVQITNEVTFSYPLFGGQSLALTPQVVLQPNQGDRLQLGRPHLGVQGVAFDNGTWSLFSRAELGIPLTPGDLNDGYVTGPQWIASLGFQVRGTKWKIETVFVPSVSFYADGTAGSYVYFSPRVIYQLSDSWNLLGIWETHFSSDRKKPNGILALNSARPSNLGVGFKYASANGTGLWVQPFFSVYPNGRVLETAHLGLNFGGPLL